MRTKTWYKSSVLAGRDNYTVKGFCYKQEVVAIAQPISFGGSSFFDVSEQNCPLIAVATSDKF